MAFKLLNGFDNNNMKLNRDFSFTFLDFNF